MDRLFQLHLQGVHLAHIGEAALLLLPHQIVLLLLRGRLLLGGRRAQGRHIGEEVVEGVLQHPIHPAEQAGHRREEIVKEAVAEEAVSEEVLHHPAAGIDPLGVAQLLRAVAAQMLFLHMAVDVAAIHKGNFILTTIFTFHKSIPPFMESVSD